MIFESHLKRLSLSSAAKSITKDGRDKRIDEYGEEKRSCWREFTIFLVSQQAKKMFRSLPKGKKFSSSELCYTHEKISLLNLALFRSIAREENIFGYA
jgi:hypothetical protein